MTLFPEVNNYSSEKKPNSESNYNFFTRVCDSPEMQGMEDARERMKLWFSHLPNKEKIRIQRDMSEGSDAQFDACFFELFLHELLLASGCKLQSHPTLIGREKAPDFAARSAVGLEFLMEATVVTDKPDDERSEEKLQGQILDMLNSLPSPRMSFAIIELIVKSDQMPSLRRIREFVMRKVDATSDDVAFLQDEMWKYEDARVKLRIRPIPLSKKTWNSNVGIGPTKIRWGGPEAAIAAQLRKKATKYGKIEQPFVIAINVVSKWTNNLKGVTKTLLGIPEEILLWPDGTSVIQKHLDSESFWYKNGAPQHRTVSAVLATRMFPWSVLRAPLMLYHNPHARYQLPDDALPVTQITRTLIMEAGTNLQEILGRHSGPTEAAPS
jgi:hypothetical protein